MIDGGGLSSEGDTSSGSTGSLRPEVEAAGRNDVDCTGTGTVDEASEDRGGRGSQQPVHEVNIKSIDGTITKLSVPDDCRGDGLKRLISDRLSVPPERQRLIFRGRPILDNDVLGQHITDHGQTIHMVQRPDLPDSSGAPAARGPAGELPSGGGGVANGATTGPAGLRFEFNAGAGGGAMAAAAMPPELSQLLGSVLQSVGRGRLGPNQAPLPTPAELLAGTNLGFATDLTAGRGTGGGRVGSAGRSGGASGGATGAGAASGATGAGSTSSASSIGGAAGTSATGGASGAGGGSTSGGSSGGGSRNNSSAVAGERTSMPAALSQDTWSPWAWLVRQVPARHTVTAGVVAAFLTLGIMGWLVVQVQTSTTAGTLPWYGWVICYHGLSLALGLPTLYLAMASSHFSRLLGTWLGDPSFAQQNRANPQILFSQAFPLMALPASQIFIQQVGGRPNAAAPAASQPGVADGLSQAPFGGVVSNFFDARGLNSESRQGSGEEEEATEDDDVDGDAAMPWRELEALNQSLATMLGRMYPSRLPSGANGELSDFITGLHGTISQLGVGLTDMQATIAAGNTDMDLQVPPHDAILMASALDQAARTFQGFASVLRGSSAEAGSAQEVLPWET